ncbi:unnamed protein product, partial [Clonostachys chloroleuca]
MPESPQHWPPRRQLDHESLPVPPQQRARIVHRPPGNIILPRVRRNPRGRGRRSPLPHVRVVVVQALRRGDHEPVPQQQFRVRLHAVVVEHLLARPMAPAHAQLAGVLAAALPELPARLDRHVVVPDIEERQQDGEVVHPDTRGEGLGRRRREHEAGPEAPAREDAVRPLVQLHSYSADEVALLVGVVQSQQGRDVLVLPLHVAPDLLQPDFDVGPLQQLRLVLAPERRQRPAYLIARLRQGLDVRPPERVPAAKVLPDKK